VGTALKPNLPGIRKRDGRNALPASAPAIDTRNAVAIGERAIATEIPTRTTGIRIVEMERPLLLAKDPMRDQARIAGTAIAGNPIGVPAAVAKTDEKNYGKGIGNARPPCWKPLPLSKSKD
jgi:hypothetical protein